MKPILIFGLFFFSANAFAQSIGLSMQKVEKSLIAEVDKFTNNAAYKKNGNVIHYTYTNDDKEDALDQTIFFDEKGRCVLEIWKYCCEECYTAAVENLKTTKCAKYWALNDSVYLCDWPYDIALRTHDKELYFTLKDIVVSRKEYKARVTSESTAAMKKEEK